MRHSPELVRTVSEIVSRASGIQLGERQVEMVKARLSKRIRELGLPDGEAYARYLRENEKSETSALVSALTTHHTYFFREFAQFQYLADHGLKAAVDRMKTEGRKTLRVWSAASSSGQEAYSLAMFLERHLPQLAPGFDYEIFGSDIDPVSVRTAANGVYHRREIKDVPLDYLANHWARGQGEIADYVRISKAIRAKCRFETRNLVALPEPVTDRFDLIFCRNVFIYFSHEQVRQITRALLARLHPAGLLFVGISESLHGMVPGLQTCAPSVYTTEQAKKASKAPAAAPAPIRVLCVDDSLTVLALLKKVLVREHGFEVVGTAGNGIEARDAVQRLKPDVMTLDIHMPGQTGLEYLRANHHAGHPPVIVVSSVSREEQALATACLEAGAADYVEKPVIARLAERGEELRTKLTVVHRRFKSGAPAAQSLSLDRAFSRSSGVAERGVRIVLADPASPWIGEMARDNPGAPVVVVSTATSAGLTALPPSGELRSGTVYLAHPREHASRLRSLPQTGRVSCLVVEQPSPDAIELLRAISPGQILVADRRLDLSGIPGANRDVVPVTSFSYMSHEYLRVA